MYGKDSDRILPLLKSDQQSTNSERM